MRISGDWPARIWGRIALATGLFVLAVLPAERNPAFLLALPSLNALTAEAAERAIAWFGVGVHREQAVLTHPGGFGYEIVLSCTGVVPAGLLTVAILASGASLRSRLQGAAFGVAAVLIANLIRLVSLFLVGVWRPAAFGFAHSVVWEGLMILLLIALFQLWRLRVGRKILRGPRGWRLPVYLGALAAIVAPLNGQVKPAPRPFALGEAIVLFKSGSEAGRLVASIPAGSDRPGAGLTGSIGNLSRELGTPVRLKQLLSGGNVLLEVDRVELCARIAERLGARSGVKHTQALAQSPGSPRTVGVRVEFDEHSPEAATVESTAGAGRETDPALQALADALAAGTGLSFRPAAAPARQLLLVVDLEALTLDLVARLRKLDSVESAQPNYLHRPMRRLNPGG